MYEYHARLLKVVDGDTVDVEVELINQDVGFETTVIVKRKAKIRLFGIDTPERGQINWAEATEFAREWFAANVVDGFFWMQTIKDRTEKYGRYLAIIAGTYDHAKTLNAGLLQHGLAVEYLP